MVTYSNLWGRTNKRAEGFNSKLNRAVNKNNPNFYKILFKILNIQEENSIELLRLLNGGENNKRKKVYVEQEERIERLWRRYNSGLFKYLNFYMV